jgi:hypothetical protein
MRSDGWPRGRGEGACELKCGQHDRYRPGYCQNKLLKAPAPGGPPAGRTGADAVRAALTGHLPAQEETDTAEPP